MAISFIAVAELYYGARNSTFFEDNILLVEKFILTVPVIQTSVPILKRFGELKARLKKNNRLLPDADIFVAAGFSTGHFQILSADESRVFLRYSLIVCFVCGIIRACND